MLGDLRVGLTTPEVITAHSSPQNRYVKIRGRVRADNRLELFPEIHGRMLVGEKPFREGVRFEKGEVVFRLDDREARLQLYARRSGFQTLVASLLPDIRLDYPERLEHFRQWYETLHPERTLPEIPQFGHPRMERFLTSRGVYDHYYQIRSTENHLEKFETRAPFSGILSSATVEPGQSMGPQIHAGTLIDPNRFQLVATVRHSDLQHIGIGRSMELTDSNRLDTWTATVSRINPSVDPRSQSVEIYLQVHGDGIREGVYLEGQLETGEPVEITEIPKSALLRNGHVYVVEEGAVRQVPVQVVDLGHHTVRVTGLEGRVELIRDASGTMSGRIIWEEMP